MAQIFLRDDETIDSAIKRWKKKVENEGILKVYKEKQAFMKPSEKKRLKKKEAIRKAHLKNMKRPSSS